MVAIIYIASNAYYVFRRESSSFVISFVTLTNIKVS